MNRREFIGMGGISAGALLGLPLGFPLVRGQPSAMGATSTPGVYPRLLYRREQALAIARQGESGAGELRAEWRRFRAGVERLLERPFFSIEYALGQSGNQHGNFFDPAQQMMELGLALGFAYHATGDVRCATRLHEALLHYAGFSQWYGPGSRLWNPPRQSELTTAHFLLGFASGYDALHDFLGEGDRATVRAAMVQLGIEPTLEDWVRPATRIHVLDTMGHNWWSVCVSSAGVAALALLGDERRAGAWADEVGRAMHEWFDYRGSRQQNKPRSFDRHGAFYEGVHYACYGLNDYLRFLIAEASIRPGAGVVGHALVPKVAEFLAHASYPTSSEFLTVNFGDAEKRTSCAETMRLLELAGFGSAVTDWYLRHPLREPVSTPGWPIAPTNGTLVEQMLESQVEPRGGADLGLPCSILYRDVGWALMRSSWEDNATLLGVKCGDTWNHAHADAGHFVIFHGGEPLLIDAGASSYSRPEYLNYYAASRAHNVVLFEGEGQPKNDFFRGATRPGEVPCLLDGAGFRYVRADATGPMSHLYSRHLRHWVWVGRVLVVFDDMRAHRAGRFDWLLHYGGQAEQAEGEVRIVNGSAGAKVKMIEPVGYDVVQERGLVERQPDVENTFLRYSTTEAATEAKFVTAIVLSGDGAEPTVERLSGSNAVGVRIVEDGKTTEVWLNFLADGRRMNENSLNRFGGWETDAAVFAFSTSGGGGTGKSLPKHCLMVHASTLRREGLVAWDSLSKVDAVIAWGATPRVELDSPSGGLARLHTGASAPAALLVNGKPAEFEHDPTAAWVSFQMRATGIIEPVCGGAAQ